jgi:hypothetical protein
VPDSFTSLQTLAREIPCFRAACRSDIPERRSRMTSSRSISRSLLVDLTGLSGAICSSGTGLIEIAHTLEAAVEEAQSLEEVRKNDLRSGDRVLVTTRNSRYTIWVLGDGLYWVSGGWFDLQDSSPLRVAISGCTWGGTAIKSDIVAARGLRLQFGNTVLTTRIKEVCVIRARAQFTTN